MYKPPRGHGTGTYYMPMYIVVIHCTLKSD